MASNPPELPDSQQARWDFARSAYEEHRGAVYAVVLKLLKDSTLAEDVVQETFLQVYHHGGQFRGDCSLRGWVLTIAVNLSRRMIIKERARRLRAQRASVEPPPPSKELENVEFGIKVQEALSRLSFEHRLAVTLSCVEGLGAKEIAAILGCKEGTVWSRIFSAKKQLASLLSRVEAEHAS